MANTMLKTSTFVVQQLAAPRPTRPSASRAAVRVSAAADRPLFFPGAAPPEYLDDSLAGEALARTGGLRFVFGFCSSAQRLAP